MTVNAKLHLWKYVSMLLLVFIILDHVLDYAFDKYMELHYYDEEKDEEIDDLSCNLWKVDKFL